MCLSQFHFYFFVRILCLGIGLALDFKLFVCPGKFCCIILAVGFQFLQLFAPCGEFLLQLLPALSRLLRDLAFFAIERFYLCFIFCQLGFQVLSVRFRLRDKFLLCF